MGKKKPRNYQCQLPGGRTNGPNRQVKPPKPREDLGASSSDDSMVLDNPAPIHKYSSSASDSDKEEKETIRVNIRQVSFVNSIWCYWTKS